MTCRYSVPDYIYEHGKITHYTNSVNKSAQKRCFGRTNFVGTIPPYDLYLKMEHQGWECIYCGEKLRFGNCELDHVYPICKGGAHYLYNVAFACPTCNQSKNGRTLSNFCKRRGYDLDEIRQRMADINQKLHDIVFKDYDTLD